MRAVVAIAVAVAGLSAPAVLAAPPYKSVKPIGSTKLPLGSATAVAAPAAAGARRAKLTLTLRLELQCGRPRTGVVSVSLPAALRLPATVSAGAVLVDGRRPHALRRQGRLFTLTLKPTSGMLCDVLGPGDLTVVFTPSAEIGNPAKPGSYPVAIRAGSTRAVARLIVS